MTCERQRLKDLEAFWTGMRYSPHTGKLAKDMYSAETCHQRRIEVRKEIEAYDKKSKDESQ